MSLKQKTLDLKKRMQEALQGGGAQAIEKQVAMGKKPLVNVLLPF